MAHCDNLPALFDVGKPYEADPALTALGHSTATERLLYDALARQAAALARTSCGGLRVLDVCCAGGGASAAVLAAVPVSELTLVDIDPVMCTAARDQAWPTETRVKVVQADATSWRTQKRFEVVLANSAYHHIADGEKERFLKNVAEKMSTEGRVLVGEHFLPEYVAGDLLSYRKAVVQFYSARISELEHRGDDPDAVDVIRQTGRYCWERVYEYQVSQEVFWQSAAGAGLACEELIRLWPKGDAGDLPRSAGTYLVVLKRAGIDGAKEVGVK